MKFENVNVTKTVYGKDGSYNQDMNNGGFSFKFTKKIKDEIEYTTKINYYKGYLLHREDGPAVEYQYGGGVWDGRNSYYLNGKLYCENDYWTIINIKKKQTILNVIL